MTGAVGVGEGKATKAGVGATGGVGTGVDTGPGVKAGAAGEETGA